MRSLNHPNILRYHGYYKIKGEINLVLELSTDGALDQVQYYITNVIKNYIINGIISSKIDTLSRERVRACPREGGE